ncbi:MAG: agmatinase family protein [Phycisphaeraceae bacterium]|nr:agmatinase family protein [Phycisphaeraceae bacterium]
MTFDPDAAGAPGSGIFGLPFTRDQAGIVLLPVPFDATTSYGHGTARGPDAIFDASMQVDLYDRRLGRIYERGIYMEPSDETIASLSESARALAAPLIEAGGADPKKDAAAIAKIDAAGERVAAFTYDHTVRVLKEGKVPGLVGGDHSTPLGAIRACAELVKGGLGILHIDAHMDFREAYEGFTYSHASIMYNVLKSVPGVSKLVQIGIRDFGEGEMDFGIEQGSRVHTCYDDQWAEQMLRGTAFEDLCKDAIARLPQDVYISFDIDGLDPALCPRTGTPVPGGLSFHEASLLLWTLKQSGRRVVGFDLVEVCPGADDEWDANVGARILYKLCGTVT